MIGDFILTLKTFIKQNTCVHDYKYNGHIEISNGTEFNFEKCTKCAHERIIK